MEQIVSGLLSLMGIYLLLGILFAVFFLIKGISKVDEGAANTSKWFRLIILPGIIIFWPALMSKWLKLNKKTN